MTNKIEKDINRILVSLEFNDYSPLFIKPLVSLASQLEAELCGLFSENSILQQVANLPFSREITFPSATTRNLNKNNISRHLKRHTENLRNMIIEFSKLSNVSYSFISTNGPRIESALSDAFNHELVVLFPEKNIPLKFIDTINTDQLINPITLFYDGSRQAQKSAKILKSLANNDELSQLNILTKSSEDAVKAKQLFLYDNINTAYKHIESYDIKNIANILGPQKSGIIILPLEDELIKQSKEIRNILDKLGCPLLLVR